MTASDILLVNDNEEEVYQGIGFDGREEDTAGGEDGFSRSCQTLDKSNKDFWR